MTKGFRITATGVEFTGAALRALTALIAFLVVLATLGAKVLGSSSRVTNAVQYPEFIDTTKALRQDVNTVAQQSSENSYNLLAMNCERNRFPSPWCDKLPRTVQSGAASSPSPSRKSP